MSTDGPLIGRESELVELEGMLARGRMVTVAGTGGCGKTRLALELAERFASAREGDRYVIVPLGDVAIDERIVDALIAALGIRERLGSTPTEVLLEHLQSRRALVVLDNCEHLLDGVGRVADEVLDGVPNARLLATSREPLGIDEESVFRLGPLSLPDAGDGLSAVVRCDAARMFVDRAVLRDRDFALTPRTAEAVAEICRRLDGLPLALELAAARLDTLTVEQIAEALAQDGRLFAATGDVESSRHRSLRASLDWSYSLLDDAQKTLLARLSVFSGGFTSPAALAVAAPGETLPRVRGILRALEAKGLIMPVPARGSERPALSAGSGHRLRPGAGAGTTPGHEPERWTILQTVAEYAAGQLTQAGEHEASADRHLAWFSAWAAQADERLLRDGHGPIETDTANLHRALDRALERDPDGALAITGALMRHWILAEHFHEAHSICAAVLAAADERSDAGALALVRCGAAVVALLSEDYEGALSGTRAGLELLSAVEDARTQGECLRLSSMVLIQTGASLADGLRNAERAVQLAERADDPLGLAFALVTFAVAAMLCERFRAIDEAYERFLAIPTACEHPTLRAWAEQAVAWAQVIAGSPERALMHIDRASELEGEWPSMTHFQVLGFRIHALARLGRTDEALRTGAYALQRARESAALQSVPAIELALATAELMHGDLHSAANRARGLLGMPHLHTLVIAHETLARIALRRGQTVEAGVHAEELEAIAERSGIARHRAVADYVRGRVVLETGNVEEGRNLLHAALASSAELGLEREAADVLDELALLAAQTAEIERCARLAAAAAQARARLGCAPSPETAERIDAARAASAKNGEGEAWETAWAQGQALSLADAIAYVRRGRGSRDRPLTGWASLTPAELEVAELAARGMSNPQIAAQLFIARGTVKMHLSHAYSKLHVRNRVELTAAHAARPAGEPLS